MNWNPQQNNPYEQRYRGYDSQRRPQSSGNGMWWLLALLGGGACGVLILCCGGGCWLMNFGFQMNAEELRSQIKDHPVVLEQLGYIESIEINYPASFSEEDESIYTYDVVGSEGLGRIVLKESDNWDAETLEIEWARLELDSGESFDLLP